MKREVALSGGPATIDGTKAIVDGPTVEVTHWRGSSLISKVVVEPYDVCLYRKSGRRRVYKFAGVSGSGTGYRIRGVRLTYRAT